MESGKQWHAAHDGQLQPAQISLLAQVALGHVTRDGSTAIQAPWLLDGVSVVLPLRLLAKGDYINMPIAGPPTLAPRGEKLLRRLLDERLSGDSSDSE